MKDKTEKILVSLSILLILASCSGKNKKININNSNVVVSKTNIEVDKNTDIMFLNTIYFNFDSYTLTFESKQNLNLLARYLKDPNNAHKDIVLSGYCDELGADEYNYKLGFKRAEESRKYLIGLGISESRISIKSYGKERQSKQSIIKSEEEARKLNRKVVIEIK